MSKEARNTTGEWERGRMRNWMLRSKRFEYELNINSTLKQCTMHTKKPICNAPFVMRLVSRPSQTERTKIHWTWILNESAYLDATNDVCMLASNWIWKTDTCHLIMCDAMAIVWDIAILEWNWRWMDFHYDAVCALHMIEQSVSFQFTGLAASSSLLLSLSSQHISWALAILIIVWIKACPNNCSYELRLMLAAPEPKCVEQKKMSR